MLNQRFVKINLTGERERVLALSSNMNKIKMKEKKIHKWGNQRDLLLNIQSIVFTVTNDAFNFISWHSTSKGIK